MVQGLQLDGKALTLDGIFGTMPPLFLAVMCLRRDGALAPGEEKHLLSPVHRFCCVITAISS